MKNDTKNVYSWKSTVTKNIFYNLILILVKHKGLLKKNDLLNNIN